MDIFIMFLAIFAIVLIITGIMILRNRSLEIGALMGIYPLVWGIGCSALALILFTIQHITFGFH